MILVLQLCSPKRIYKFTIISSQSLDCFRGNPLDDIIISIPLIDLYSNLSSYNRVVGIHDYVERFFLRAFHVATPKINDYTRATVPNRILSSHGRAGREVHRP